MRDKGGRRVKNPEKFADVLYGWSFTYVCSLPFQGIILSINARNSRQEYISLELNEGRLELVHSMANGSKVIEIPARISDGLWHQMAIR